MAQEKKSGFIKGAIVDVISKQIDNAVKNLQENPTDLDLIKDVIGMATKIVDKYDMEKKKKEEEQQKQKLEEEEQLKKETLHKENFTKLYNFLELANIVARQPEESSNLLQNLKKKANEIKLHYIETLAESSIRQTNEAKEEKRKSELGGISKNYICTQELKTPNTKNPTQIKSIYLRKWCAENQFPTDEKGRPDFRWLTQTELDSVGSFFQGAIIYNCNFDGLDLSKFNLCYASMEGSSFRGAILPGDALTYSNLKDSDLSQVIIAEQENHFAYNQQTLKETLKSKNCRNSDTIKAVEFPLDAIKPNVSYSLFENNTKVPYITEGNAIKTPHNDKDTTNEGIPNEDNGIFNDVVTIINPYANSPEPPQAARIFNKARVFPNYTSQLAEERKNQEKTK